MARKPSGWWARIPRDVFFVGTGMVGMWHQIFIDHVDRPALLVASAAWAGIPIYLRRNGE